MVPDGGDPEASYLAHGGMLYVSSRRVRTTRLDLRLTLDPPSLFSKVGEETDG